MSDASSKMRLTDGRMTWTPPLKAKTAPGQDETGRFHPQKIGVFYSETPNPLNIKTCTAYIIDPRDQKTNIVL
jgi:hypothetical protein